MFSLNKQYFIFAFFALFVICQHELPSLERQETIQILNELKESDRSPSERLHKVFQLYWDFLMTEFPEYATYVGHAGQNDRWTDLSPESLEARSYIFICFSNALHAIDPSTLSEQDRHSYLIFTHELTNLFYEIHFNSHYLLLSHMQGVHLEIGQVLEIMPANSIADYIEILARLKNAPLLIDQSIALLNKGLELGITPPQVTLDQVPSQVLSQIPSDATTSPFFYHFAHLPDSPSKEIESSLQREALATIVNDIYPAFQRLYDFLVTVYIPQARISTAMTDLPNGEEWYKFKVQSMTTTNLTPQQIHQIGLSEVARIKLEMHQMLEQAHFDGTFEEFVTFLNTDEQFFFNDSESALNAYRKLMKEIESKLPILFGKLPQIHCEVVPVPVESQGTAYYLMGSLKANRPGYFFINLFDLKSRPKWEMAALTLHESLPGHHMQIMRTQEIDGLPEFQRYAGYTAYIEGWGLYSECLGEEFGLYDDPYMKFGKLNYEMLRAVRLVVDTGMHALGWSREQAIVYFMQNVNENRQDACNEIDRYLAMPGQALAYKIGELKFKELRTLAEKSLGSKFDIRMFHDHVLGMGTVPLDMLEASTKQWIAEQ